MLSLVNWVFRPWTRLSSVKRTNWTCSEHWKANKSKLKNMQYSAPMLLKKYQHRNANRLSTRLRVASLRLFSSLIVFRCQKHFEAIRLFLSHYGFCSLDSMNHLLHGKQWVNESWQNWFSFLINNVSESIKSSGSTSSKNQITRFECTFIHGGYQNIG